MSSALFCQQTLSRSSTCPRFHVNVQIPDVYNSFDKLQAHLGGLDIILAPEASMQLVEEGKRQVAENPKPPSAQLKVSWNQYTHSTKRTHSRM
ncbi:hypothetical protein L227DRAFT_284074 [Lentinus tigrinus ALCF2SS1-6]|uniref:Uncharacterized protein n=1 Tax=Lentinus tigrinus ALCF2SS1-6 TaxID=1328759 RepID=A0A5C2RZ35_9APHY|nr:hypothetical protein L227DRAFT_284074 [Lentinus tigrinus ALCF2SS1-6]